MELAFPWPASNGEWLAWSSAALTALYGLVAMFFPATVMKLLALQVQPDSTRGLSEMRGTLAGFHLGVGLSAILLAQPLVYTALGVGWGLTAFGRLLSILSDRANTLVNWIYFLIEIVLAALPLAFVFGMVR